VRFWVWLGERLRARSFDFEPGLLSQPDGDFRGRYGFGRRAHKTDPNAHYGFEPDTHRATRQPLK
jgi:hypothetical protein